MSLIEFCKKGDWDLDGVKAALQSGVDVNSKDENGYTALKWAVIRNHIPVIELLLDTPNIDVNLTDENGWNALIQAVDDDNIEAVKLLLKHPNIDVNNVEDIFGRSALNVAVLEEDSDPEVLELLLSHPSLTAHTLNMKETSYEVAPVMLAVCWCRLEHLALLVADPRVDLDTTDNEGRSLEEVARCIFLLHFCSILSIMPISIT